MVHTTTIARQRWVLNGQVQGVGFRPFVHRLAHRLELTGFVRNDTSGVTIEVQGPAIALEQFATALVRERPALSSFRVVDGGAVAPLADQSSFDIEASESSGKQAASAQVTIDAAVCEDCLAEMFDAADRRHRYGLINCTNCGPRYSIIEQIPYDRPHTTMAGFALCDACADEYGDPSDRRFHAQPTACHACGPRVSLVDAAGRERRGDPYKEAARLLRGGRAVAIKGLGGFHLAVRADDDKAVARLRKLKHRDHKPFAVMCRSLDAARKIVRLSGAGAELLQSPASPIVLAPRRAGAAVAPGVAPNNHRIGVMLPNTPIQHLLFAELEPSIDTLVMTSANLTDEPLVIDNDEAVDRLCGVCDAMLWHDRPIARCVDDSVMLDFGEGQAVLPVRRARGFVPAAIALGASSATNGLCVGGELKNTVAVVRGGEAILSQHLGDLTHTLAHEYFKQAIDDLCGLFEVQPQWIAHDMHPMYLSTVYARALARRWNVPLLPVQHYHAHAAAVLAEHSHDGPALAVVLDGVGYGSDGGIWGGELLLADRVNFQRLAHLRPLRLAGGDAAARDTRRCALALLHQAFGDDFARHPATVRLILDNDERLMLTAMVRSNVNCAQSSGAGRVFDGVAALLGVCEHNHFEAQAAMRLESLATQCDSFDSHETLFSIDRDQIDLSPLVRMLVEAGDVHELAALLHEQLACAWATVVQQQARRTGVTTVALSGGVFCNQVLTMRLTALLERRGLTVLRHEKVAPNDGGLALGQAAVASARIAKEGC